MLHPLCSADGEFISPGNRPRDRGPSIDGVTPEYSETTVVQGDMRRAAEQRLVADDFRNPVADVYRLLRSQVLQRMKKQNMTTIAVTGARSSWLTLRRKRLFASFASRSCADRSSSSA